MAGRVSYQDGCMRANEWQVGGGVLRVEPFVET